MPGPDDELRDAGGEVVTLDVAARQRRGQPAPKQNEPKQSESESREPPKPPEWNFVNPVELQGIKVPEREFLIDGWLATGHVTLNYGDGGVGKTLLAQQLMTSVATGKPWCGLAVSRGRAIGLFCEDNESEMHRRQAAINRQCGIDFIDLEDMRWASGVGEDNTFAEQNFSGAIVPTQAFATFVNRCQDFRAKLIVIDTAADTFGGDENNRRQVRQYIGTVLGRLARELNAAVVLNAHPSRSGLGANGDMDGGSTAWSNTARARWSLARQKAEGDEQPDTDIRILTRRKANYATIGDTIRLRRTDGALLPIERGGSLERLADASAAETVFLELLRRVTEENRPVSDSASANNGAPRLFAKRPDRQGFERKDFEAAMQRLFANQVIAMAEYGRASGNGRPRRIVLREAPKGGLDV